MRRYIARFLNDQDGAVTVDFVIIAAGVSIIALGVAALIVTEGTAYGNLLSDMIADALRS